MFVFEHYIVIRRAALNKTLAFLPLSKLCTALVKMFLQRECFFCGQISEYRIRFVTIPYSSTVDTWK